MNNTYKNIKKNKVYAYVRCSKEENNLKNNGSSVKTQIFRINSYCNIHSLKISETFIDYCSGGIELEKREQGKILFSKLKNNNSIIISSDLSRFSRNHLDLIQLVHSFRKRNIGLHFVDIGSDVVSTNSMGTIFFQILSIMNEWFRNSTSEKQKIAKNRLLEQGKHLGGRKCLKGFNIGKNRKLVVCEKEMFEIRFIKDLKKQGKTYREIKEISEKKFQKRFHLSLLHKWINRDYSKIGVAV